MPRDYRLPIGVILVVNFIKKKKLLFLNCGNWINKMIKLNVNKIGVNLKLHE